MKIRKIMAMILSVCLIAASASMAAFADEIGQPEEQETEQETIIENATPSDVVKEAAKKAEAVDEAEDEKDMARSAAAQQMQLIGLCTSGEEQDPFTLPAEVCTKEFEDAFANSPDGSIKLTCDVKMVKKGETEDLKKRDIKLSGGPYSLDLNGYDLNLDGSTFLMNSGVILDIYDSTDGEENDWEEDGKIYSSYIFVCEGNACVNLYGGCLYGQNSSESYVIVGGRMNIIRGRVKAKISRYSGSLQAISGRFDDFKPNNYMVSGCGVQEISAYGPWYAKVLDDATHNYVAARIASDGAMSLYESLDAAINAGDTVVLLKDVNQDITIPATGNVTLNLMGHVVKGTGTGDVITVAEGGKLTLLDYEENTEHTGEYASLPKGGVITGATSGSGVKNMGTFIMNGGAITENAATNGGGVYNSGTFRMNGGTIAYNYSDLGGGVYNSGTMTIAKDVIIAGNTNSAKTASSNLYLDDTTVELHATGLSEDAVIFVSVKTAPTEGNPVAITGENSKDYSDSFQSDSSAYEIADDENTVMLQIAGGGPGPGPGPGPEPGPELEPEPGEEEAEDAAEEKPVSTGSVDSPVTDGVWNMGPGGAWTYRTNGLFKDTWGFIANPFAKNEAERYGWFWFDKYGTMATGWKQINGKWYYFNTDPTNSTTGMLLMNTVTPDGYKVGADGAFIQ